MSDIQQAESITLRSRRHLAPSFHRHIARSKIMNRTCRVGDSVVIYDVVACEPPGAVRVTETTRFQFE